MTPPELQQALDRLGTDLDHWPQDQAILARQCLATSREARRVMDTARRLDVMLAGLSKHSAPSHLAARIVARAADAAADPVEQALGWFTAHLWRPVALALLLTTAGFLAGTALSGPQVDAQLAEDVMTLAFSDIYAELEDVQP